MSETEEIASMAGSETDIAIGAPPGRRRKLSRLSRWLIWIGAIVLLLALAAGIAVVLLLQRAEPMLRSALIDTLQNRFHSRVELDSLHLSMLDGFQVEGQGLRIWLPKQPGAAGQTTAPTGPTEQTGQTGQTGQIEPWITVGKMRFRASWRIRPGEPVVVDVIHVEQVRVLLPPKEERPHWTVPEGPSGLTGNSEAAKANPAGTQPVSSGSSLFRLPRILVKRIECNDAQLLIERRQEPGKIKPPLDFELRKVTLIPDGRGGPIAFSVDMVNARPVGVIHSTGHVGPWVTGDTGALPLDGDYTFDHADLGTIKGIAGMLSSTGRYSGTLGHIETEGQTLTPDFRLERIHKGTGVRLQTNFHAIVDGTNGDTWLQNVDASLGHTHIQAKGQILRADDILPATHGQPAKGHDIALDVTIGSGRIEDILEIAADADQPFMTGSLTLQTKFHLPPGQESVWEKLQLNGQFHLSQARFSNPSMQGKIEQLSLRGQGKPGEVKSTDPTSILSEMQGHFDLAGGQLKLPDLDYRVPGAEIVAHGTYGLQAGTLDFVGDAKLKASLSQVVGGWKGLLLKPVEGYLRKNGAGTDVPIHVNGTRQDPKFGVDFDRLGKTEEPENLR